MLFALYVLNSRVPHRGLIFETAAFVILASILAHGLTDTAGARWIEGRMRAREESDEHGDVPGRLLG